MDTPNLIDPIGFYNIKRYLEKKQPAPKQIGGFFDFLSDKNNDNLRMLFTVIFFLLIVFFFFYRYQQKQRANKQENISQFLNSVDNYLNTS